MENSTTPRGAAGVIDVLPKGIKIVTGVAPISCTLTHRLDPYVRLTRARAGQVQMNAYNQYVTTTL